MCESVSIGELCFGSRYEELGYSLLSEVVRLSMCTGVMLKLRESNGSFQLRTARGLLSARAKIVAVVRFNLAIS